MINLRKINGIILVGLLVLLITNTLYAQKIEKKDVGPLDANITRALLVLEYRGGTTYLLPTIRLKIKNTSSSDIKLILFRRSINITDNLGQSLFTKNPNDIKSSGILLSDKNQDNFSQAFQDERTKFITLAPQQSFDAQLSAHYAERIKDRSGEFIRTHQPRTIDFSATIGIIKLDDSTELRCLSFSEVPLSVSRRGR